MKKVLILIHLELLYLFYLDFESFYLDFCSFCFKFYIYSIYIILSEFLVIFMKLKTIRWYYFKNFFFHLSSCSTAPSTAVCGWGTANWGACPPSTGRGTWPSKSGGCCPRKSSSRGPLAWQAWRWELHNLLRQTIKIIIWTLSDRCLST